MRFWILILFLASAICIQAQGLRYVNTMVGTGSQPNAFRSGDSELGQCIPAVLVPNGMTFWTPQTESSEKKSVAPYYYSKTRLQGFRSSHWIVGGCTQDYGSVTIMPMLDTLRCTPEEWGQAFSHGREVSRPDYYRVEFIHQPIVAEMTGLSHTGIFRFTFRKSGTAYIVINPNSDEGQGSVRIDTLRHEVVGNNPVHRIYQGWGQSAGFSGHFLVKIDRPVTYYGVYANGQVVDKAYSVSGKPCLGAYVACRVRKGETITVKVAQSFCDTDGCRKNMEEEIPDWNFNQVRERLTKIWNDRLSVISVASTDKTALRNFYTAFYHASFLPHEVSDVNGRHPAFADGQNIVKEAQPYYDDFSLWDTYRALHPLMALIYPEKTGDMIQSLVEKYEQGGWMPIFPCWNSYTSEMIGDHTASLISEAYLKGVRNFDVDKAYEALRKNAFEQPSRYVDYCDGKGRRALWDYQKYGFIPLEDSVSEAFHKGEQVSRTLEYAYDDHALSLFAKALGRDSDAMVLRRRSQNYRNVIDPATGWCQGRYANGQFLKERNAFKETAFITEGYPSHYTWYVPHDVYGLMECMGGRDKYVEKLDSMFSCGYYWHGNEPCHQVAFMYGYAGQPWKTQREVRSIMEHQYHDTSDGLSGNDDAGQMSAWYMFAAMGFYPVSPVDQYYMLASPSFSRVEINLPHNKKFTIFAKNASKKNIYVQSAVLNGKPYEKNYLDHAMIANGGVMVFSMGDKPSKWGTGKDATPPLVK